MSAVCQTGGWVCLCCGCTVLYSTSRVIFDERLIEQHDDDVGHVRVTVEALSRLRS